MTPLKPDEMLARIKKGKPVAAILLLGEEPYLRDTCRAKLIEHYVAEAARAWAVSRFSAERDEVQAALDQAQTLPMLSPQQLVFLEQVEAVEEFAEKKRDEAVKQLESYLADPAPFTTLVVEAAHLDQRMRLAKVLTEKPLVVQVGLGEDPHQRNSAALAVAGSLADGFGVRFEPGAAEDLSECVAGDLQRLKTEVEKLAAYAAEKKVISRADVALLVVAEKAATVWELADLLAGRRAKPALELLDRLLREGEEPLQILGAVAWMYRKLVEASELKGALTGWQAARSLQMRPDQAELALRNSRKLSKPRLLAGLAALQRADDRLKSGEKDSRAVMEFLIAELAAVDSLAAAR
jgi:DNA polymerase-3 subunit delta